MKEGHKVEIKKLDGPGGSGVSGTIADGDWIRITYNNGAQEDKIYRTATPLVKPDRVFMHIHVTGPKVNNVVSINADGSNSAIITLTLRKTNAPDGPIAKYDYLYPLPLRNSDGFIHDYIGLRFVGGVSVVNYVGQKAGAISIDSNDINDVVGGKLVTLVTAPRFLIYTNYANQKQG